MGTDREPNPDLLALSARSGPFFSALKRVAGFKLPTLTKQRFLAFHASIAATPRLPVLTRLTVEGGSRRDWLTPFTEAVLGHVQEGLAASYYHLANVESIEREMISLAQTWLPNIQLPKGSAVAGGNTRRLNFEYQAFVFALRRTMEYFAVSVGAFFKCEAHRIRTLADSIAAAEPPDTRDRVRVKLDESLHGLSDVLPPADKERSVRDQLAHWRAVDAGVFNVTSGPEEVRIFIAGGGENIHPWDSETRLELKRQEAGGIAIMALTPILRDQIMRVESLVFDVYSEMGLLAKP